MMAAPQKATKAVFAPPQGDPPSIAMIPPGRLMVDPAYQRSLDSRASAKLIEAIAATWDWRLCVPLIVSQRSDGLYVIDGQHRREAAVMRGDIGYLPCSVSQYASPADEARLFVQANRRRRAISRVDDFRAAVAAGDPRAAKIDELVRGAGLAIARHANARLGPGELAFTSGLLSALDQYGADIVGRALDIMGDAFPDSVLTHGGALFAGLVLVLADKAGPIPRDRIVRALGKRVADGWGLALVGAVGGQGRAIAMRKAIVLASAAEPATVATPVPIKASPPAPPVAAAPTRASAAARPPAPRPAPPGKRQAAIPMPPQPRFCEQCDRRVSPAEASACKSRFCAAKAA